MSPTERQLAEDIRGFLQLVESLERPALTDVGAEVARTAVKTMTPDDGGVRRCQSEDMVLDVAGGQIPLRIYRPRNPRGVLVFLHGGGWVLCDLDTHDEFADQLAHSTQHVVVSVGYRLAPEHPYPIPLDDAYAALCWAGANVEALAPGCSQVAIAGDSAGGNLAIACSLKARDQGGPRIRHQLLLYPVTDISSLETPSYSAFADGYYLRKSDMAWFAQQYVPDTGSTRDPYVSPLCAVNLQGLPPTYLITAGFDVLRDEGTEFAAKLKHAGVPVHYVCYPEMIHGFLTLASNIPSARTATERVLREAALELCSQQVSA
ncbi:MULTISPECIES: alpha/beta hydrolase [Microbulbifer]|uniref:alpha/beta hydrolase n=1 Tax=Microbulbifer TaxID=48073 RepID=UPI001CD5EB22|nr:alpha/beta hydrolase [Microbulbifer agarilyticus]MCA0900052.1 alpha/beta hydrolase [Microbulbifer agarilyticus]